MFCKRNLEKLVLFGSQENGVITKPGRMMLFIPQVYFKQDSLQFVYI